MSWFSKKIKVDEDEYACLRIDVRKMKREYIEKNCAHEPVLFLEHYVYCKLCRTTLSNGTEYENVKYMANHFKEMRKKYKGIMKDIKRHEEKVQQNERVG